MPISSRLRAAVALIAAGVGALAARPAPIVSLDQEQPRLDAAPPPLANGSAPIRQSFVAGHDGLSAVEVLAAVYPVGATPGHPGLILTLLDSRGSSVAEVWFQQFEHNAPLRLTFTPQPHSAGQTYTFTIQALPGNNASVWAYSLDGYARGSLATGEGDLRFSTFYTYQPLAAARGLELAFGRLLRLALPLWLLLFAPGLLLLELFPPVAGMGPTRWARWGLALGLSLAALPLLWLWVTVVGLRWTAITLGAVYALSGLAWLFVFGHRRLIRAAALSRSPAPVGLHDAAMLLILLLGFGARLLAARDLILPPWVDSPHHYVIASLMAESGRVPRDYSLLLPIDRFTYHFGYHALAASAGWLARLPLEDVMLPLGQALNALAPLAAYTLTCALTARPRAGLVAAFLVGLVSLFPAYYLAWGRYTQLAGLLVLAPAIGAFWATAGIHADARRPPAWAAAGLAAGLLLTHYRLFAFFAVFVVVALALGVRTRSGGKTAAIVAVLGAVLASPWIVRLATQALPGLLAAPQGLAARAGYNAFPAEYFQSGLERGWLALALLAAGWGLVRRDRALTVTAGWVAVTFALLNLGPGTFLVNNNAWAITLFLPGAVALGWGVDQGLGRFALGAGQIGGWGLSLPIWLAVSAVTGYAGALGLRAQVDLVKPVTVLATADDAAALAWVRSNTPREAVFMVNGWPWLSSAWASPDGGAWLMPLTGRRSTLPPVDYLLQPELRLAVDSLYASAPSAFEAGADSDEALALLRRAGVTHIYIGAKGGTLRPEMFAGSARYRLVYSNGAAWVFEVIGN